MKNPSRADHQQTKATRGWRAGSGALALLVTLASTSCSRPATEGAPAASYGTNPVVSMQPHLFSVPQNQMGHVQVVPVKETDLARVLRLPGSVAYNAFETTPVIAQVGGPVTRVLAAPGQFVRAGQPLCYVSSPEFSELRSTYLKARDAYELAQNNFARTKDLYAHHAVAEVELLTAQSARYRALADLEAARQSLAVLGIKDPASLSRAAASPEIPLLAPISGEVVERQVSPGQVVQAGSTQVFTISNMATVWVLINVFQQNLGAIHYGDPVTIETDAYPEKFHGRISYIAPALDPTTRTLQVRAVTNNPGLKLKKDMYVTAVVRAGTIAKAMIVPDAAVLRNSENRPFVYVEAGPRQFGERLVTIGASEQGSTQILSGLKPGDRVVGNGALFLQFANSRQR
jgi:cobalt-zinc-cadmium efflux system membrane fusion protein